MLQLHSKSMESLSCMSVEVYTGSMLRILCIVSILRLEVGIPARQCYPLELIILCSVLERKYTFVEVSILQRRTVCYISMFNLCVIEQFIIPLQFNVLLFFLIILFIISETRLARTLE